MMMMICILALESDDPERLRIVIQETLSRLTGDTTLNDNAVNIYLEFILKNNRLSFVFFRIY